METEGRGHAVVSHYCYAQDVRSCFDLGAKNNLSRNGPAARNRSMYEIASSTSISFSFVDYPALGQAKIDTKVPLPRSGVTMRVTQRWFRLRLKGE